MGHQLHKDGTVVDVQMTWLRITREEFQGRLRPHPPFGEGVAIRRALAPCTGYFLYLYDLVGHDYDWTDKLLEERRQAEAFADHPQVELYALLRHGAPAGLFQLDFRSSAEGICDLSYFGLAPGAVGRGLGHWFLGSAMHQAFDQGIACLTLNTCTLDHPNALPVYQRAGFSIVGKTYYQRKIGVGPLAPRTGED